MKVLFFVRDLGLGGVERCVTLVAAGLAARGFEVSIALLGGAHNLWSADTAGVRLVDLSTVWHGKKPWTWLAGWRAARALAREADVVIASTFLMPLYMTWAASRGLPCRLLAWVHGPLAELDAFAGMNPVHRAACQFIYRRLPEILCVSEHSRQSLARWLKQPSASGWQVMPNFVAAPPAPDRPPRPVPQAGQMLQLLFVGRVAEEKQPQLWLDTLSALAARGQPAALTVLGDGPLRGWVETEAARRQLNVRCIGQVGDVAPFMRQTDWLLLTSNFEGFGLVVLEAMQLGLPVVSTDSGGVRDFFAERVDEFVVADASGDALATSLLRQLPQHHALSAWLQARATAYAPEAVLAAWERLLRRQTVE